MCTYAQPSAPLASRATRTPSRHGSIEHASGDRDMRRGSKWGDLGRDWPEVNSADKCRTPPKSKRIQLVQPSINWVICMTRINAHRPEPNAWPEYLYPRLNHRHDMGYTSLFRLPEQYLLSTITTYRTHYRPCTRSRFRRLLPGTRRTARATCEKVAPLTVHQS